MSMKPVVRSMTDAMDGLPVHVRQLAEMFRKHGSKHKRNDSEINDLDRVPPELRDGWKTDGKWEPDEVVAWGKGNRPDPSEYLDGDYIRDHLAQFENGATRIYKKGSLEAYGPGNAGTTYVFPTDQLDRVMREADGDPDKLADALGLPDGFFKGAEVELRDFGPHELDGLRMPSGNEGGTDLDAWIPGGYLPSGIPEAVIDIPDYATGTKNGIFNPGEWPGGARPLILNDAG